MRNRCALMVTLLAYVGTCGIPPTPAHAEGDVTAAAVAASRSAGWRRAQPSQTVDVALDAQNRIHGAVYRDDKPAAGQPVELWAADHLASICATDTRGRFVLSAPRGGQYIVRIGHHRQACRLWARGTAPPQAVDQLLIVASDEVIRGQRPIGELFRSDLFILGGIAAVAIAIPIAVYSSREDRRSGS